MTLRLADALLKIARVEALVAQLEADAAKAINSDDPIVRATGLLQGEMARSVRATLEG